MQKRPLEQVIMLNITNHGGNACKSSLPEPDSTGPGPQPKEVKELLLKIGLRTKELRYKAGLTQEYFHKHLGINISRIETGKYNVSVRTLYRICWYLETDIENFFSGINR